MQVQQQLGHSTPEQALVDVGERVTIEHGLRQNALRQPSDAVASIAGLVHSMPRYLARNDGLAMHNDVANRFQRAASSRAQFLESRDLLLS